MPTKTPESPLAVETATTEAIAAAETAAEHELVVLQDFLGYVKGQIITEAKKVKDLVDSEWQTHFVKKQKTASEDAARN